MEKVKYLRELTEEITDIIEQLKILENRLSVLKDDMETLRYKLNTDFICD